MGFVELSDRVQDLRQDAMIDRVGSWFGMSYLRKSVGRSTTLTVFERKPACLLGR